MPADLKTVHSSCFFLFTIGHLLSKSCCKKSSWTVFILQLYDCINTKAFNGFQHLIFAAEIWNCQRSGDRSSNEIVAMSHLHVQKVGNSLGSVGYNPNIPYL